MLPKLGFEDRGTTGERLTFAEQVEQTIESHGMREQALDDLNRVIAEAHVKLTSLGAS